MPRYIDADILREEIDNYPFTEYCDYSNVIDMIDYAPTVEVQEVKHGRWIDGYPKDYERGITAQFKCSECGRRAGISQTRTYKYCPKCGAKMDESGLNNEDNNNGAG